MSVSIDKLFAVAGTHVGERERERLMGLLQRYNAAEFFETPLQTELRTILSKDELKATLIECFPDFHARPVFTKESKRRRRGAN